MLKNAGLLPILITMFLLGACGGQQAPLSSSAAPDTQQAEPGFTAPRYMPALPEPQTLSGKAGPSRQSSAAGDFALILGRDYDDSLPNQGVFSLFGEDTLYIPGGWSSSGDPADLGYAIFSFDLTGLSPLPRVRADWVAGPFEGLAYFAVANFDSNRWEWFSSAEVAELSGLDPYTDAASRMLVLVLQSGPNTLQLGSVSVGTEWSSTPVVDYGEFDEIQLDQDIELALADGRPAIAWIAEDFSNDMFTVKFARALDSAGDAWGAAVTVLGPAEFMPYISLAIVDGKPAIAWQDFEYVNPGDGFVAHGSLMYVQALDAQGQQWGDSVVVDDGAGDNHGISPHMTIVNGMPAISYASEDLDGFSKGLMYVQAGAADGSSWNSPVTVKGPVSGGYGIYNSPLAVIDGFPAIAYQAGLNQETVGYVRATDADGTAWSSGTTFIVPERSGFSLFLRDLGGVPAMVYDTDNTGNTYWRLGMDADGGSWNDPVLIYKSDLIDDPGSQPVGLVLLDGKPAVLVDQYNANRLVFVRADDAAGTGWGAPEHVCNTQEFSGQSELLELGGVPSFLYVSGGKLIFSQLE
ncbi:MAG: hypothetical protein R3F46_01355 [bacterium]